MANLSQKILNIHLAKYLLGDMGFMDAERSLFWHNVILAKDPFRLKDINNVCDNVSEADYGF